MSFNDPFGKCQPQPRSLVSLRRAGIELLKLDEQLSQLLRGYPDKGTLQSTQSGANAPTLPRPSLPPLGGRPAGSALAILRWRVRRRLGHEGTIGAQLHAIATVTPRPPSELQG